MTLREMTAKVENMDAPDHGELFRLEMAVRQRRLRAESMFAHRLTSASQVAQNVEEEEAT